MSTPKTPTHRDLLEKIKRYNAELIEKVNQYTQLCTSHSLPNMTEPMTSEHIREKIVADMFFFSISRMGCDRTIAPRTVGVSGIRGRTSPKDSKFAQEVLATIRMHEQIMAGTF